MTGVVFATLGDDIDSVILPIAASDKVIRLATITTLYYVLEPLYRPFILFFCNFFALILIVSAPSTLSNLLGVRGYRL